MSNRLIDESSPYLIQHAHNPVDWYPWGPAAHERARFENKPIFLSIGYSACHWCHVMEHESFQHPDIAAVLNEYFVSIKVDREERPDLDQIYMLAVQMLTGAGGWPMSVFLTPQLKPFHGGTYWPPEPKMGMPGFNQVLTAVWDVWSQRRDEALAQADRLTGQIQELGLGKKEDAFVLAHGNLLVEAIHALANDFDRQNGGFGAAPKFPAPMILQYLLRAWHRNREDETLKMVTQTLDAMAAGGIYDHLGGGFARYSVDNQWLVPHFEKMLYDNGLLAGTYLDAFVATGEPRYAQVAQNIFNYTLENMLDEQGGFHCTEDADSEGEEGKFYVWTQEEIEACLGRETARSFCRAYGVSADGNFEGKNILYLPRPLEQTAEQLGRDPAEFKAAMQECRTQLQTHRQQRERPHKDDKILISWNAFMIESMARGGRILKEPTYVDTASRAAKFLLSAMRTTDGRLLHSYRHGRAHQEAFLDDYASLTNALITLYEVTFEESWIEQAMELITIVRSRFLDPSGGGFFFTADDHESLIARQKDLYDQAVPSSNGLLATALVRLGKLCGRADFISDARGILDQAAEILEKSPRAAGQLLLALDMIVGPFPEIVLLGDAAETNTSACLDAFWSRFIPNRVIACRSSHDSEDEHAHCLDPIFLGRTPLYGTPSLFVCRKFACDAPVSGKEAVLGKWGDLVAAGQQMPS